MSQKAKGMSAQEKQKSVILAPPLDKKSSVKERAKRMSVREQQGTCCKSNWFNKAINLFLALCEDLHIITEFIWVNSLNIILFYEKSTV